MQRPPARSHTRTVPSADPDTAARCLELLDAKLLDVTRVVPADALSKLKAVHIWLERSDPEFARAEDLLAAKYEQYRDDPAAGPIIAIDVTEWRGWSYAEGRPVHSP